MASKPKLHELIAVEGDLQGTTKKILEETATTFDKKPDHFQASRREVKMIADTPEAQAEQLVESSAMSTTVEMKLAHLSGIVTRYYDAVLQKELTNQTAKADLVLDGKTLAKDVPATFLLGMEDKLKALRAVYDTIPTLAPGKTWVPDVGYQFANVFVANDDEVRTRTKKIPKAIVLYEATKEHPAQVKELIEDVTVGTIITRQWSGMVTPGTKSDYLARIDKLIRACKKARQRANSAEVVKRTIGRDLFAFINDGVLAGGAAESDGAPDSD